MEHAPGFRPLSRRRSASCAARVSAGLAGLFVTLSGSMADAADLSPERQTELRNLVLQDCGSCHGMTLKGGLGTPLLPDDLEGLEAATIAEIVLDGVPDTPMPPWRGLLSDREALWIARSLKTGIIR